MSPPTSRTARVETGIFFTLFALFGFFHQGGGWNQNVRFDQIRSIVEAGTLAINDYCQYRLTSSAEGDPQLAREPVPRTVLRDTRRPLNSLDIAIHDGRILPNKPPGSVLLALPAYAALAGAEAALGIDPDAWSTLTINLYLVTLLSVGLAGALGGVVFYRVSRRLFPAARDRSHAAATLALFLGTPLFAYATLLFDHVPVAVLCLASFAAILRATDADGPAAPWLATAGLAAGLAVVTNYAALLVTACLAAYAATRVPIRQLAWLVAGGAPAALLLGGYHALAFGSPFTMSTLHQHELFRTSEGVLLGVFSAPKPGVALRLLLSPTHGLFLTAPPVIAALVAWFSLWRSGRQRPEALLALGISLLYLVMNASFYGWHGGSAFGPRYLVPAIPFLALPLALAFDRLPALTTSLVVVSALLTVAVTARNPLTQMSLLGPLAGGPVSANAVGVYEGAPYDFFARGSFEASWNAFNLGELLAPGSWLSVLPAIAIALAGGAWLLRATRDDQRAAG